MTKADLANLTRDELERVYLVILQRNVDQDRELRRAREALRELRDASVNEDGLCERCGVEYDGEAPINFAAIDHDDAYECGKAMRGLGEETS